MAAAADPELSERAASVLEWGAKTLIGVAAAWGALEKIAKPYGAWRAKQRAEKRAELEQSVQAILGARFATLDEAVARYNACADRIEQVLDEQQRVLLRQAEVFAEFDFMLAIVDDTRERQDETNVFLDTVGFAVERRTDPARGREVQQMMADLVKRQRARRRMLDAVPVSHRLGEGERNGAA